MNKAGSLPSGRFILIHALKRYYEPLRLPLRPNATSFPYTRRLMFLNITVTGLQHWVEYLPQHAIPATPEDHTGRFRYQSLWQRPSPFDHRVGIFIMSYEATCGFTCVTACCFANWELTTPCCQDAAPLSYRGERITPRTGLKPVRYSAVTANSQTYTIYFVKSVGLTPLVFDNLLCQECRFDPFGF